jgi:hypothetical protein
MNKNFSEKFPKTHSSTSSAFNYLKDIWVETFPNEERKVKTRLEKRKEAAKLEKEMEASQEYID